MIHETPTAVAADIVDHFESCCRIFAAKSQDAKVDSNA